MSVAFARRRESLQVKLAVLALVVAGCTANVTVAPPPQPATTTSADPTEAKLDEVAKIHGAPGPWAVAGYRMSEYAMAKLGLSRGSFDLEITHHTPKQVKYSCIADGAAAYSGASAGKLNLNVLTDATPESVETEYRNKKTGQKVVLKPAASFEKRYANTPREHARALGREVLGLPANEVFEEVPST